ncbi:MAG TPA: thiamine pyrophosphate-binding protein [Stellaceae bacterium]|nr:thiamine pyrophosphate-binding protein [Stellaceae bacterium]
MATNHDGGEAILEAFRSLGVEHIMSSPGSEWSPVWEALARQKTSNRPGPDFIECWHETLAVNMAMGYTQYSGKMQAVLLHAGVGLMQGEIGIHTARNFEIPMVVMSGESITYGEDPSVEPGAQWYGSLGIVGGPQRIVEPVTKWAQQAGSVHTLYEQTVRAGEMAQHIPQAPTYIDVPLEHMLAAWTPPAKLRDVPPVPKLQPMDADIQSVADMILKAKNPVVVTDSVGKEPDAFRALVALCELMAMPVGEGRVTAYGNFPKDHPMYLGMQGGKIAKESDCVLLVKSRAPWYPPSDRPPNATVIAISENPLKGQYPYQNLQADHYLEGDVAATLKALAAALKAKGAEPSKYAERHARAKAEHDKWNARLRDSEQKAKEKDGAIDPLWLVGAIREVMPKDTIYLEETIMHSGILKEHLPWNEPQCFYTVGGGLGQGTGIALGVKMAAGKRPVVLFIGDGAFLYNPITQALGASKQHSLPILIIVCNNLKYSAMQRNHMEYYPKGVAVQHDVWHGVHIDGPEYSELGKPFGFHGTRVEKASELVGALKAGLASIQSGTTSILNVMLSR